MISNFSVLSMVLSVQEVAALWGKNQKTVMMAIYKDRLIARQAAYGRTWFISKSSVYKLWGQPTTKENENAS